MQGNTSEQFVLRNPLTQCTSFGLANLSSPLDLMNQASDPLQLLQVFDAGFGG